MQRAYGWFCLCYFLALDSHPAARQEINTYLHDMAAFVMSIVTDKDTFLRVTEQMLPGKATVLLVATQGPRAVSRSVTCRVSRSTSTLFP